MGRVQVARAPIVILRGCHGSSLREVVEAAWRRHFAILASIDVRDIGWSDILEELISLVLLRGGDATFLVGDVWADNFTTLLAYILGSDLVVNISARVVFINWTLFSVSWLLWLLLTVRINTRAKFLLLLDLLRRYNIHVSALTLIPRVTGRILAILRVEASSQLLRLFVQLVLALSLGLNL